MGGEEMLRALEIAAVVAAIVFAVALIGLVVVYSSQPPHQPQHQQSAEENQTSNYQGKGSKSFWERTTEDPIAFFTFWLVVFSMVLAGVGVAQLRLLLRSEHVATRSADAAKESADATRKAVELSERNTERQLRAYVSVSVGRFQFRYNNRMNADIFGSAVARC